MFPGGYYPPKTVQEPCATYNYGGYAYPIMPPYPSPSCCTTHGCTAPAYPHIYPHPPPPSSSPTPPPSLPYHHHIIPPTPAPHFHHFPYYFQYPTWTPMPPTPSPTNCCCACPNYYNHHQPLYHEKLISANNNNNAKPIPKQEERNLLPVDVNGSSSTSTPLSPPLVWYNNSPQLHNLLQHQADPGMLLKHNQQGPQHRNPTAHLIPFQPDMLDNYINKTVTNGSNDSGTRNYSTNFPFPVVLMPYSGDQDDSSDNKNKSCQREEKLSSGDIKTLPEEHVDDETRQPLPVKTLDPKNNPATTKDMPPAEDGKVRVKSIPVKQEGEIVAKPFTSSDAPIKSQRSRSVSPTRTPKLPPVCLRVDPLPRKKGGNGTSSPSAHKRRPSFEDSNAKSNGGRNEKLAKDIKVHDSSFKESLKDIPVAEVGKRGERRVTNDGEAVELVKLQPAQSGTTGGCMAEDGAKIKKKISEEEAAVRIQSAYRGFEERRWQSLQKLREIAQVREQISSIKDRIHALENDPDVHGDDDRQRVMIGETIMSLLLKLDTIQGLHPSIRDARKSVAKELISLQEKLDSFLPQRSSKKGEIWMDDSHTDAVGMNQVKQMLCENLTEKEGSEKHEEGDVEKVKEPNGKAVDEKENLKNTVDFICAEQHQELRDDCAAPTELNQVGCEFQSTCAFKDNSTLLPSFDLRVGEAYGSSSDKHSNAMTLKKQVATTTHSSDPCPIGKASDGEVEEVCNTGDKDNSQMKGKADDTTDNGRDTEVITFSEDVTSLETLNESIDVASKYETVEKCDIDNDRLTVSVEQITPEGEGSNSLSGSTTVKEGEVLGHMSELGQVVSNVNSESVVEVRATTLEHQPIDMEEQSESEEMRSANSGEEGIIAINNPCALPEVTPNKDQVNNPCASPEVTLIKEVDERTLA